MNAARELLGVNVGGTTTTIVRGDAGGALFARRSFATNAQRGAAAIYADIVANVRALSKGDRLPVGIAIGGPLDVKQGIVVGTPHLPFKNFPLRDRLAVDCAVDVAIHHDAAACALAEYHWGADAGSRGLAYLTCGTGFGVGLILDGHVRYGSLGHSAEIGHVRYRPSGPDVFGKPGCYEGFGSATAIALLARARDRERFASSTPADVVTLAGAGNVDALAALREHQRAVGAACAMLTDILALDVIVLGSLALYLGEPWIEAVREAYVAEALPEYAARCQLRAPSLESLQDRSALAAALTL